MGNLHDTAEKYNLEIVDTSSERNGYPSNLKQAIIGFETFEDAEKVAEETGGEIIELFKKDGWDIWSRRGSAYKSFTNSSEKYGDDYSSLSSMEESEFIEEEVKPFFEDNPEDFEAIEAFLEKKKEVWEEIEKLEDNEIVITCEGRYHDTIKEESMYFQHDTKHHTISVVKMD